MRLLVPCSSSYGETPIPFDTSKISLRAATGLSNFGIYDLGATLPYPMFEVQNLSNKSILFLYITGNLVDSDPRLRVIGSNNVFKTQSLDYYSGNQLLFGTGTGWSSVGPAGFFLAAQNGGYSGIFNLTHIAGYAIDMTKRGIGTPYNFDNFEIGSQVEGFKLTTGLQIPFTGQVNYFS